MEAPIVDEPAPMDESVAGSVDEGTAGESAKGKEPGKKSAKVNGNHKAVP